MGLRSSTGISDPIQRKPTSWNTPSTISPAPEAAINPDKGNAKMWGYPGGSKPTGRLYKQHVFSTQKRWGLATNNKCKSSQSVCGKVTFQDGRYSHPEGHHSLQRLHGQTGPKGCLLFCTGSRQRQEVRVGEQTVRVNMPTIWPHKCTLDIHKAVQTSSNIFMTMGNPLSDVSRRQGPSKQLSRGSQGEFRPLSEADHFLGVHHQLEENCPTANTDNRISGVHYQLNRYDPISLLGEAEQLDHRMQETTFQSTDNTEEPVSRDWADDISNISCAPSPPTLQEITISEKRGIGPPPLIRVSNPVEPRVSGGSALVVRPPEEMERPPNTPSNPSDDSGNRCFQYGVGSILSSIESEDRGVMEPRGVETPHQRQRTPCCLDCSPDFCKHPQGCTCSHQDGQHFSNSLYKSHGRYTLSRAVLDGDKDVELVIGSRTDSLGRTSTRMPECYSRLRVQEQEGPLQVGVESNSIPEDYGSQGRMPDRSICLPPVSQASNILQLEARPRCISSRCPCSRLEQYKRLCLPPLLSDWQISMQNKEGESGPNHSDNSTLALTTMVPSSDGDDHRYPPPPTSNHGSPTGSTGESHPLMVQGHLQLVSWLLGVYQVNLPR